MSKIIINRDGLENSDHWETPDNLLEILNNIFHFDCDPCPLHNDFNTWDGLLNEWGLSNFINPPYNRFDKPAFIQKTHEQYKKGKTCVLLIPSCTGTKQFHELLLKECPLRLSYEEWLKLEDKHQNTVVFLKGRLAFKGINTKGEYTEKNKGKSDSIIVILTNKTNE